MNSDPARLDIVPVWARFNDELINLVDFVPDDKMNWSPKPQLWNFRGILMHIAATRDNWLKGAVHDGIEAPDVYATARTRTDFQEAYRRTWARLECFLSNAEQLDAIYQDERAPVSGHWIAFHLLEHDIHHRADIFHYLALLGIETPGVGTP